MNKTTKIGIVGGIAIIFIFMMMGIYNGHVNRQENARQAWSQVENVLQRRMDLIPNYVEIVKGYAKHEKELLTEITEARAQAGKMNITADDLENEEKFNKYIEAQNRVQSSLSRLLVVVENYPNLKANENFLKLQDELAGTENRISVERKRYNEAATEYNKALRKFPRNIMAGVGDFKRMPLFKAEEGTEKAPKISFD